METSRLQVMVSHLDCAISRTSIIMGLCEGVVPLIAYNFMAIKAV